MGGTRPFKHCPESQNTRSPGGCPSSTRSTSRAAIARSLCSRANLLSSKSTVVTQLTICDAKRPLEFVYPNNPSFVGGRQKGPVPMRKHLFLRAPFSLARGAARSAAVLATLGLVSAGIATGATTFQLAYMYGTSGPASGGTAVNLVGNQFDPGATVTIGGVSASASVTSSTRIGATTPGRNAGALYDVVVTNPGNPPVVLTKGWFADFLDVPQASPYHAPVETIIRDGITSGCGGGNYCPTSPVTRGQMAVFLLRAEHGSAYVPPPATGTIFGDVTVNTSFADWIEQLYAEGITGGCLGGSPPLYCPTASVTRGQMATFLLKIYHGTGYAPAAASGVFSDVPVSMPLAPWIEEMARLSVTTGCGGNNFCPGNPVTRGQMAVFLAKTFHRPEAIRFLQQATWGPKDSEISGLLAVGNLDTVYFGQMVSEIKPRDGHRDYDSENDCANEPDRREPAVEHDVRAKRQTIRTKHLEQLSSPCARHHAEQSTGGGEEDSFGQHLPNDMLLARAHRLADRHFFRPAAGANQEQIDQIDRADEEEEKHATLHEQECWTDGAHVMRVQRNHRRAKACLGHHFCLRAAFLDRSIMRVDLCLRFGDRDAWFQARDHMRAATAGMARGRLRRPRFVG